MTSKGEARDSKDIKPPQHEQLWGKPISQEEIDNVKSNPMRNDEAAKALALRAAHRMIENDEQKRYFHYRGTKYFVIRTYTKHIEDSDKKTTPTRDSHKSVELEDAISLPGYRSRTDKLNMFNLMTPLMEDFEYFRSCERQNPDGNIYFTVSNETIDYSIAEWEDGSHSKNVDVLNIFDKTEVVQSITDINTKTLTEMEVHEPEVSDDNNEQTQLVEVSLDALEDDDKPDGFDSWPVEAKVSWANSNLHIDEIVDEVESVTGTDIDRNQSGSPSKKGIAQMYAIIHDLTDNNE